jgi:hypothetical protein
LRDPRLDPLFERIGLEDPRTIQDRLARAMLAALLADRVLDSGRPLLGSI